MSQQSQRGLARMIRKRLGGTSSHRSHRSSSFSPRSLLSTTVLTTSLHRSNGFAQITLGDRALLTIFRLRTETISGEESFQPVPDLPSSVAPTPPFPIALHARPLDCFSLAPKPNAS